MVVLGRLHVESRAYLLSDRRSGEAFLPFGGGDADMPAAAATCTQSGRSPTALPLFCQLRCETLAPRFNAGQCSAGAVERRLECAVGWQRLREQGGDSASCSSPSAWLRREAGLRLRVQKHVACFVLA